ncbi:MAG: hypothetical protein U0136_08950 [Bdellovibrionota bacterium]
MRVSRRYYAWFCLGLVFLSGGVAGAMAVRFYIGATINRFIDSDENQIENFIVDLVERNFKIAPENVPALRQLLSESFDAGKVAAMRNRPDIMVVLNDFFTREKPLIDPSKYEHFDMIIRRALMDQGDANRSSFCFTLDLSTDEMLRLDEIYAKHYQELRGDKPLSIERLRTVGKELLIKSIPELRPTLSPEKQAKLDALGPNLENLKLVPRRTILKAFEWPGFPEA